jgi:hypothetical protein
MEWKAARCLFRLSPLSKRVRHMLFDIVFRRKREAPVKIKVTAALTREIAVDPRKRAGDSFENY